MFFICWQVLFPFLFVYLIAFLCGGRVYFFASIPMRKDWLSLDQLSAESFCQMWQRVCVWREEVWAWTRVRSKLGHARTSYSIATARDCYLQIKTLFGTAGPLFPFQNKSSSGRLLLPSLFSSAPLPIAVSKKYALAFQSYTITLKRCVFLKRPATSGPPGCFQCPFSPPPPASMPYSIPGQLLAVPKSRHCPLSLEDFSDWPASLASLTLCHCPQPFSCQFCKAS